ncbi:QRFP-like peptide receptor [Liolophura sinensis]|uniref:QRFP-like peptide receptor n=1 Tax=Liolophura sinensis TaxID=3198878 RepID=UPI0031580BB4
MRVPNNFFFASLSIADLLVLVICQPSALLEFYAKDRWYLGTAMCKLVPFLESTAQKTSVLTIAAISFERYHAICRPLQSQYLYSRTRTVLILTTLWITAALVSCPFAAISLVEDATFYDGSAVKVCRTKIYLTWHYVYVIILLVVFFLIPLVVLLILYSRIMFRLTSDVLAIGQRNDQRALMKLKLRRHSVYLLIAIILLFFISLLPMRVFVLWVIFAPLNDMKTLGFEGYLNLLCFIRAMVYFNSATNPVVYSLMSSKFRAAFWSLLRCKRTKKQPVHMCGYYLTTSPPHHYCVLQTPTNRLASGVKASTFGYKLNIMLTTAQRSSKFRSNSSEEEDS